MTGYARAVSTRSGVNLTWLLKSLNGRSREVLLRIPPTFEQFANKFRSILSAQAVRGRIEAELQVDSAGMEGSGTQISRSRIFEIRAWVDAIRKDWDLNLTVDPLALLQWPGVLVRKEPHTAPEKQACDAQELLIAALVDLEHMQAEEGERLRVGLNTRLSEMVAILREVRHQVGLSHAEQLVRLRRRMESFRLDLDPARLEQELVLLVQKTDVSEELDRLESHLTALASTLETGMGGGRKLDFLLQEMQREVNTLSAKIQNAEISHRMVDLKVIVEQMREQVQNIG